MTVQKRGLGRGLSALLGEQDEATAANALANTPTLDVSAISVGSSQPVSVNAIQAGKFQPRSIFREEELAELAASITKNGVVQPIIVRRISGASVPFEIVAGERRFRASKLAGLAAIPAIVVEVDDKQALEIALVENIQRRDLAPTEVASGYQRLMDEFSYTQEALGDVLGKSRSQIANTLRLLELPEAVKSLLNDEKITFGHARALLGYEQAEMVAEQIVARQLSVRQTEQLIKQLADLPRTQKATRKIAERDPDIVDLEKLVSRNLGLHVRIENRGEKGRITVEYQNLAELDKVLRLLEPQKETA